MAAQLHRRDVVAALLAPRTPDTLVVSGLGSATWDVVAAGDCDQNFGLIGGMGLTAVIGLGLAQSQPEKKVLVITGDGDMLMGMGSLATIANKAPRNLSIVVLDNEMFGETGGQPTHTAGVTDLAAIAAAAGIPKTGIARTDGDLKSVIQAVHHEAGPQFHVVKVIYEELDSPKPPLDGAYAKDRFRVALLGAQAAVGGYRKPA
jgi:thiamine pyrophosphate-dependent acetolactate synthase large subunit-like protein